VASNARLITMDRPGYSATDPVTNPTFEVVSSDVGSVIDDLDLDEVALVGWSGGDMFAIHAAAALGNRVRSLSLVCTPAPDEEIPWIPDCRGRKSEFARPVIVDLFPVEANGLDWQLAVAGLARPGTQDRSVSADMPELRVHRADRRPLQTGARAHARTPSEPLVRGSQAGTGSISSWLHPLKAWSLQDSRRDFTRVRRRDVLGVLIHDYELAT